jgi:hypothetical protein
MLTHSERRITPPDEVFEAAREWLGPVREALGHEFLSAYLTGSVLTAAYDPRHSRINVLVFARTLTGEVLERLSKAIPAPRKLHAIDPLFLTKRQMDHSLDSFPIEWLEIQECHLLIEGEDIVAAARVPRTYLRLQCEHELRGKHIRLRQYYLLHGEDAAGLEQTLAAAASSFATLFRTLLRLRGETVPADSAHVIQKVADIYHVDAKPLLGAHVVRYSEGAHRAGIHGLYRGFVDEVDRLVLAINELNLP